MANIVNCKNKLLKNNYYFALSTSNVSNPTKLLANLTGIANSGAKCFYFTPDALVVDFDRTAPTVGVCVPTATQSDLWPALLWLQCQLVRPLRCKGMICHHLPTPSSGWDHSQTKDARLFSRRPQSPFIILTVVLSSPDGVM